MWLLATARFLVCWSCFILFIGSFGALADQIRELSTHIEPRDTISIAFLVAICFLASAAWWTTLCKMRSHRFWVIAFSLANLLTFAYLLVVAPSFFTSHPFIWFPIGVGVLGLMAYLPPYEARISAKRTTPLRVPDQE